MWSSMADGRAEHGDGLRHPCAGGSGRRRPLIHGIPSRRLPRALRGQRVLRADGADRSPRERLVLSFATALRP